MLPTFNYANILVGSQEFPHALLPHSRKLNAEFFFQKLLKCAKQCQRIFKPTHRTVPRPRPTVAAGTPKARHGLQGARGKDPVHSAPAVCDLADLAVHQPCDCQADEQHQRIFKPTSHPHRPTTTSHGCGHPEGTACPASTSSKVGSPPPMPRQGVPQAR